jgi:hypothetical protein
LHAISAPNYDIGIFDPTANEGDGEMHLRTWSLQQVFDSIDWLRYKNANGWGIYVRPSGSHAYTLIDDLSKSAVELLMPDFEPSAVVETSPGNFQAWLYNGEVLPPAVGTRVATIIAERFDGDPGAAAWRQFGRLAGFTNNKQKYRQSNGLQPYVRLQHADPCIYPAAAEIRARAEQELAQEHAKREHLKTLPRHASALKSIDSFHSDPRYGGDLHRADLAFATYALAHGAHFDDVVRSIAQRDLSHKGSTNRQQAYIDRTVRKAADTLGLA